MYDGTRGPNTWLEAAKSQVSRFVQKQDGGHVRGAGFCAILSEQGVRFFATDGLEQSRAYKTRLCPFIEIEVPLGENVPSCRPDW